MKRYLYLAAGFALAMGVTAQGFPIWHSSVVTGHTEAPPGELSAGLASWTAPADFNTTPTKAMSAKTPQTRQSGTRQGGEICETATEFYELPYMDTGTTDGYYDDYEEMDGMGCPYDSNSPDVVYSYTPPVDIEVTIDLCNSQYDTKVFVYEDICTSGTAIACDDDSCPGGTYKSIIEGLTLAAGHTYYIVVDGYGGGSGEYELNVTEDDPCPPPPNDNCEDVSPVTLEDGIPVIFTGDNTCATNQCLDFSGGHVWEAFTLTESMDVTLDYCGTDPLFGNAWLNLTKECPCETFTEGGTYDSETCGDGNLTIRWTELDPGTYYYPVLRITDVAEGPYTITVVGTPSTPCEVDCPPGGIAEGEPDCHDNYDDYFNPGCNNDPPVFSMIACGDTICGTGGTFENDITCNSNGDCWAGGICSNGVCTVPANTRDTDWYEITVIEETQLIWSVEAEFTVLAYILDGNQGCEEHTTIASGTAGKCEVLDLTACVAPGTYWLWAGTNDFSGVPCPSDYVGTVVCQPCPMGACCLDDGTCEAAISQVACEALGGTWQGADTVCDPNPCPQIPDNDTCDTAEMIEMIGTSGSVISNNTLAEDDATPYCGTSSPGHGMWYVVVGTGTTMTMTTCSENTDFDTKIQVFCDCGPMVCVGGNDDDHTCEYSSFQSTGSWCSEAEQLYFVQVGGYSTAVGTFELIVSENGVDCSPPVNCTPTLGACCLPDGGCLETTASECDAMGGEALEIGTACLGDLNENGHDDACEDGPCEDCGPGPHWVDTCSHGMDHVPSGALVGIDIDDDCLADASLVMIGPVTIQRSDPLDDSVQFPGLAEIDGHLDVIDTEILYMSLESGGYTLIAGADLGAVPLAESLGAIAEQPDDPLLADSFFDVYFEIELDDGTLAYNQDPLHVDSVIDCVPPNTTYIHPVGCIPMYDSPTGGTWIANLVTADHDLYPMPEACCLPLPYANCVDVTPAECVAYEDGTPQGPGTACSSPPEACCLPTGECLDMDPLCCDDLGGVAPESGSGCQGDGNHNGIDDACEDIPCGDCGPGPHWVDVCSHGADFVPSGALVGIDTDLDCVVDGNLILSGPATLMRSDPMDDSVNYPGVALVDGHLDVIDTEMVYLGLTGGGYTLTAGAGYGYNGVLSPSMGAIVEQPDDNLMADSFFDVYFEIDLPGPGPLRLYNHEPLRIESEIPCVPPPAEYIHPVVCLPLYTSPVPGEGYHYANLVTANHETFLACGSTTAGDCFVENSTPFCNNLECCEAICDMMPECCEVQWTQACADAAAINSICNNTIACCMPDGSCVDTAESSCTGISQGEGSSCEAHGELCRVDCNENEVPDMFDVLWKTSVDLNENFIPDECEAPCCDPASYRNGDWDGDCDVDLYDFAAMQICLGRQVGRAAGCKTDGCGFMDLDMDRDVDLPDHALFVDYLTGPVTTLEDCDTDAGTCDGWGTGPPDDPGLQFGGTYYVFGDPPVAPPDYDYDSNGNPPIPSGFFGPGSEPFHGVVELGGQAQSLETMGTTDTLIEHPPLRFGFGALPVTDIVPARLSSLSLRSREPIVVYLAPGDCNSNGFPDILDVAAGTSSDENGNGVPDECEWFVAAEQSPLGAEDGYISATKTHQNGGVFDALINIPITFVFVKMADLNAGMPPTSGNVKVLDTVYEGLDPIVFEFFDQPFSLCVEGENIYTTPCGVGNFIPAVDTSMPAGCPRCPDVDGDGMVNVMDVAIVMSQIGCDIATPDCAKCDINCDEVVDDADAQAIQNGPCFGLPASECPDCGDKRGPRKKTTCVSHLQPNESHYFCPPRCIESICTYWAVGPPWGTCFPWWCAAPACPPFPANIKPGAMCTALDPNTCPKRGYFMLALGPFCPIPPCVTPIGVCVQFYGFPITCTPTGRFLCP
ncbi:MAG: hypothetical protein KAV82_13065 [Phycisphaerae bacterium]|nr:hypothetical protein [Phycisphaerae bacterium]